MLYSRREALKTSAAAVGAFALGRNLLAAEPVWLQEGQLMNTIPSSGEQIPAMGLGTEGSFSIAARVLDEHGSLREVLRLFSALGGRVIDAAPTWDPGRRAPGPAHIRDRQQGRDLLGRENKHSSFGGPGRWHDAVRAIHGAAERHRPGTDP